MIKQLITLMLLFFASQLFAARTETEQITFANQVTFSNGVHVVLGTESRTNWPSTNELNNTISNKYASTNLNQEGIRQIGALGNNTLNDFLNKISLRGVSRDAPSFAYTNAPVENLNVLWTEGYVYSPTNGYYRINSGSFTLVDHANNYAYWNISNPNTILWTTGTRPNVDSNILIATFVTSFKMIAHAELPIPVANFPLKADNGHSAVMPSIIVEGLYFYPLGTNLNQIAEVGGIEYHNMSEKLTHSSKNLTNAGMYILSYFHTNSTSWSWGTTNLLPIDKWDNGTNLVDCTTSNWYRGVFLSMADSPMMHWVYPQVEYTNYQNALEADDPTLPPGFDPYIPKCTAYIFQGGDTNLRTSNESWIDRRFMITRGASSVGGGGGGGTPSLYQVLLQGSSLGGILPYGAGLPSESSQLTSKEYVDSTINNINAQRAYVDSKNGNDSTAIIESSILTFKTIQAAIDASSVFASDENRFVVTVSPGTYNENITMKNYIGIYANDIEATRINGSVTYPPSFVDWNGSEIQQITVNQINGPALIVNSGIDEAYSGVRSCYLVSTYDNNETEKNVVLCKRGQLEIYATTYLELNLIPTNGSETTQKAQIYNTQTDPTNNGLAGLISYNSSHAILSEDENDDISLCVAESNSTFSSHVIQGGVAQIYLNTDGLNYSNNVKLSSHYNSNTRTFVKNTICFVFFQPTNSCNTFMGYSTKSVGNAGSTLTIKDNLIYTVGSISNSTWFGAATHSNDHISIINSVIMTGLDETHPQIYTNAGSTGTINFVTTHIGGDFLVSGKVLSYRGTPTISNELVTKDYVDQGDVSDKTYSDNSIGAYSNKVASTNSGSEGLNTIGAFGGYTLKQFFDNTYLRGISRKPPIFTYQSAPITNLTVSWTSGSLFSPLQGFYEISPGTNVLVDFSVNYAYWNISNPNTILWTTGTRPNNTSNQICLTAFVVSYGRIMLFETIVPSGDLPLETANAHAGLFPSIVKYGLTYYATETNLTNIAMTEGIEYNNMSTEKIHNSQDLSNPTKTYALILYGHTNSSSWSFWSTNQFPINKWDDGTNITTCTTSNWYRGVFLSMAQSPFMHYVYPQVEYTNYQSALEADDPTLPPGCDPYVPKCTAYIFQGGDTHLKTDSSYWIDRRFMIRRGNIYSGGSIDAVVPTLYQVVQKSRALGGILPNGAGLPSTADELANKQYVDMVKTNLETTMTNLQSQIISNNLAIAFDAYVTNNWRTTSGTITTLPFTNNESSFNCFSNTISAFVPPVAGWYQVSIAFSLPQRTATTIYLSKCNQTSTNVIQSINYNPPSSGGSYMPLNLNAVFYDNGQTNWYIARCLAGSSSAISGGTNGPTRFNGHFIGR